MKEQIFKALIQSLRAALFVLIYTFVRFMLFGDAITADDISFNNKFRRSGKIDYRSYYRRRKDKEEEEE